MTNIHSKSHRSVKHPSHLPLVKIAAYGELSVDLRDTETRWYFQIGVNYLDFMRPID